MKSCLAKTITLSPTSIVVEPVGNMTDLFLISAPIATPSGNGLSLSAVVTSATSVSVNIVSQGTGYNVGDVITINNGQLGGGSQKPVITLKASDFNSGSTYGSTNFELQESEQTRLILKILLYAGIIIRDPQIVQAAASEVQQNEINQKS